MLSNSGERWLISITDMPLPRQSSNSSRMRSSTGSGKAPGPALKLKTRLELLSACKTVEGKITMTISFRGEHCAAAETFVAILAASQNTRVLRLGWPLAAPPAPANNSRARYVRVAVRRLHRLPRNWLPKNGQVGPQFGPHFLQPVSA